MHSKGFRRMKTYTEYKEIMGLEMHTYLIRRLKIGTKYENDHQIGDYGTENMQGIGDQRPEDVRRII